MGASTALGRSTGFRRVLVLPLTVALTGATALVLVPITAQADTSQVSATVVLRTPASAEPLAETAAMPRSARLSRLQASIPSAADQSSLLTDAASFGLTVESVTPWSAVVHGSATAVRRLDSQAEVSSVVPAGGPAPVPAADPTPLWGNQFRTAYQASSAKPVGSTTPVVATIQFSGWDNSQLGGYVTNANANPLMTTKLPSPPAGEFTAISVDGASTTDGGVANGDTEVALDQESLYATYPYAKQRAYFAPGNAAGMVAALDMVAADAVRMPGLVALSVSWTFCETSFVNGLSDQLDAMHAALGNVVAAGVTVFAASGDTGTNCNFSTLAGANYPASDPLAVAVGGTSLTLSPTTETAWSGSGGGTSAYFPKGAATKRVLPDIAADADPDTGFDIWQGALGWGSTGGTSLASPVAAAGYVAELGSRGALNGGLGDLHNALSSAPASDFRDITSGSNGTSSAGPGYDQVTGRGAPLWQPIVNRLLTQPVIQVPATSTSLVIPVAVTAPAGQTFLGWATGSGTPPACSTSAGKAPTPQPVTVPADATYRIWAEGYVGYTHCFIVSTTTVVTGHTTPPPVTTSPAPVTTSAPVVTTTPPVTVTTNPAPIHPTLPVLPVSSPTAPPLTQAPPGISPPTRTTITSDVTPPAVTLSARQTSPATTALSYAWDATDGTGSGVQSVSATVFRDGTPVWTASVPSDSTLHLNGVPGHAYRLGIVAADVAGNIAGFTSSVVRLPYDDRAFALGKGWHRSTSQHAFGGSYVRSATKGATASVKLTGSTYTLLTSTGPTDGVVAVYVDGKHVRDISLYSKATRTFVKVSLAKFAKPGKHRITLVVKGSKAAHAKETTVAIDGLLAF